MLRPFACAGQEASGVDGVRKVMTTLTHRIPGALLLKAANAIRLLASCSEACETTTGRNSDTNSMR